MRLLPHKYNKGDSHKVVARIGFCLSSPFVLFLYLYSVFYGFLLYFPQCICYFLSQSGAIVHFYLLNKAFPIFGILLLLVLYLACKWEVNYAVQSKIYLGICVGYLCPWISYYTALVFLCLGRSLILPGCGELLSHFPLLLPPFSCPSIFHPALNCGSTWLAHSFWSTLLIKKSFVSAGIDWFTVRLP